ncbi:PREDICTED: uncharacterized protein LOC18589333 isoform X1 [Theobroma cacao]|uniref:Uncharacterized protein LOC18589333 isoform X1 n=1 Tax=Theobroma cacao TaxID=3641 RepID=A0AB32WWH6_THECC|nr:PREDICTED: uncharacterized protein LOC18589333 isoform X1 [Theobroma cacao]XP_007014314.2 PREDICTED: uncharacterized protein LOC18589333 isoform X1 [Theobroma cacao]XP_017982156.1 PREDICTED: uncharacterized protein LOC18589333 isoform X1 [Theobroma cacao]
MNNQQKEMRRGYLFKNSIAFVLLVVSLCCFLVVIISMLNVPDAALGNAAMPLYKNLSILKVSDNDNPLSTFGNMMIQMLPQDLAFTVFIPSETAFTRDLRLRKNDSLVGEKMNDAYAVISRVLGFSAIPRILDSATVPAGGEVSYDSLSGFTLFVSKDVGGVLMVNGVKSERVDIRRGKHVVHVMDGVIMDAEFEQSVEPDFDVDD